VIIFRDQFQETKGIRCNRLVGALLGGTIRDFSKLHLLTPCKRQRKVGGTLHFIQKQKRELVLLGTTLYIAIRGLQMTISTN
jgi:hypothetical protein